MKKSKYIIFIEDNDIYLCYNTINGSYLRIGKKYIDGQDFIYSNLSDAMIDKLDSMHFIVKDDENENEFVYNEYKKVDNSFKQTLFLTIEITNSCNFSCAFCYQKIWTKRKEIALSTIQKFIHLIHHSDLSNFSEMNIDFIGGEPLLYKEKVLYVYDQLSQLCGDIGIKLSVKLNTNGYYLSNDIIDHIKNTEIMFPYLSPQDYNNIVSLKGNSTEKKLFNQLRSKIISWVPSLNRNKSNFIVFRFNANHQNVNYISDYFSDVASFGIEKYNIAVVNTQNNDGADFINNLSGHDFSDWYVKIAMPLCAKYHIRFPLQPRNAISRCKARRPYSFKLFADGRIGLCNGIDYDPAQPKIDEIESLGDIDCIYKSIKNYRYIFDDNKCLNCKNVFLCGGKSPCNHEDCVLELSSINEYILMKSKL